MGSGISDTNRGQVNKKPSKRLTAKIHTRSRPIPQAASPKLAMSKVDNSSHSSLAHLGSLFNHLAPITALNIKARVRHSMPKSIRITATHPKVASNRLSLTPTPLHQELPATQRSSPGNPGGLMRM